MNLAPSRLSGSDRRAWPTIGIWDRAFETLVIGLAVLIAAISAQPFSFSPNDGSRLATVEALIDHGTLAIDRSIFVAPPPPEAPRERHGYHPGAGILPQVGTVDKVIVRGRFYSDKPPVPSMLLAGWYGMLQLCFGLRASERADLFCYFMTLGSCGLAYVMAVWATYRLGRAIGLHPGLCLGLAGSLGLATMAGAYLRAVNGHIQLLGLAAVVCWMLERLRQEGSATPVWRVVLLGSLGGLGYAMEQPTGGLLLAAIGCLVLWRRPGWLGIVWLVLGSLPWVALHHGVTYAIAGTWKPINAVPEHFDWPGCEFSATNMTGRWNHPDLEACILYGFSMLFGERGFVTINFPLHLAAVGLPWVWWRGRVYRPELLALGGWCLGTWGVYAALSTNFAGICLSVRWFVPLLVAGSYVLALMLRLEPRFRAAFWAVNACGVIQGGIMWYWGLWFCYVTPGFVTLLRSAWIGMAAGLFWGFFPRSYLGRRKPPANPAVPVLPAESFGFVVPVDRHTIAGPKRADVTDQEDASASTGLPADDPRAGRTA